MAAAFAIVTTLAALLMQAGMTATQIFKDVRNQQIRDAVLSVASTISDQLKSGRLNVNRLLALLQNKNAAALQQYLYSNPMTSKSFDEIQADTDKASELQAAANQLENVIAQLQSELSSLGYSTSIEGTVKAEDKFQETKAKLADSVRQYDALQNQIAAVKVSPYREQNVDTSHLDAVSQNLKGGLNNA